MDTPDIPVIQKMTTIKISSSLRDDLKRRGRMDETYNDLLIRLLKEVDNAGIKL